MSEQHHDASRTHSTDPHTDGDLLQLVSFRVGQKTFAVPIFAVHEINRAMPITPAAQGPAFIEGTINLRGSIIPVIDLRNRFSQPVNEHTRDERTLIVEVCNGGETHVVGLTVDQVHRVLRIPKDSVAPASAEACGANSEAIAGVSQTDEGDLFLLSLDQMFSADELDLAKRTATGGAAKAA